MVAGCVDPAEPEPELGTAASPVIASQGTTYQGTTYQGTTYQGTTYQGTTYQGTTYQGAQYAGAAATGAIVSKTTLEIWRWLPVSGKWEQRTPNKLCIWNSTRTSSSSCTTVNNLNALSISPLAGVELQASFRVPATGLVLSGTLRIGGGTTASGAVLKDTSLAMHSLIGQSPGSLVSCDSQSSRQCASNSDLFLYDLDLIDPDGTTVKFCPPGERAYALAGTWGPDGTHTPSTTQFTFACTSGTIAKCTRWGYRPFGSAQLSDNATMRPLADYHQACIRAAMADYCADGRSSTRNGTQIEIYDFTPGAGIGLVPRTPNLAPAFLWESGFDKLGGAEVNRYRYPELAPLASHPSQPPCSRWANLDTLQDDEPTGSAYEGLARVYVDSKNGCAHSEGITGRPLSRQCSACVARVVSEPGIGRPSCESMAWDSQCVSLASQLCLAAPRMAAHNECTTGAALGKTNTACTWDVCSDPAYAGCCTSGWTSACTSIANTRCTGGREHTDGFGTRYGFCGVARPPVLEQ